MFVNRRNRKAAIAHIKLSAHDGPIQERPARSFVPEAMISERPAPTWIPLTTGMGITAENHRRIPVTLNMNMQAPTNSPAAAICGPENVFEIATAAMAFIGCTGSGIPKKRPVRMLNIPENIKVLGREIVLLTVKAMRMGKKVPRSPKAPEISDTGLRRKVWELWLLISRNVRNDMVVI